MLELQTVKWDGGRKEEKKKAKQSSKQKSVERFLVKLVCRYTRAKVIITDQGREFCNALNDDICKSRGIGHRKTTAYHSQSNGQTERYNQTLCNAIVKYTNNQQNDWDEYIDPILLAYRTSVHKTTQKTLYFLAFGIEPTLLIE